MTTTEALVQCLKVQMELGSTEIFFEEPLEFSGVRPKLTPPVVAAPPPESGLLAKPIPPVSPADFSLLTPQVVKRPGAALEDMQAIEQAASIEAFHEGVMHHPFYRLGPSKAGRISFGVGPMHPQLMLVGFIPSEEDLRSGGFFTGAPSELLRKLLESLSHSRNLCYTTWLVKKPLSAPPLPRQIALLRRMLQVEVSLVKPELILFLGEQAYQASMASTVPLQTAGGTVMEFAGIRATAIYDPAQMHANPGLKTVTWKQHLPKSGFFRQPGM